MTGSNEQIAIIRDIIRRLYGELYVLSMLIDDLELTLGNHSTENKCCDQKTKEEGQNDQPN